MAIISTIEAVIGIAGKEIGDREATGNNDGPRVEVFLASCGLGPGPAWCAAFIYWLLRQVLGTEAIREVWGMQNPAYCPDIYTWARRKGVLHSEPRRGDVFLYMEDGWALHTGLVTGYDPATQRFTTIEGNTSPGGSSEGDGVYARSRPNNGAYVFVRWGDLLSADGPVPATFAFEFRGQTICNMPVSAGRSYIWLGDFARATGQALTWDTEIQKPELDGVHIACDFELRSGKAWARISDLLQMMGVPYSVDLPGRRVVVS